MFTATNACGRTQLARAAGHEFDRATAMAQARAAGRTGRQDAVRSADEVGFAALSAAELRFNVPTISAIQTTATGGGQTQVTRA
ncbi:MAG: hypothetical protein JJT81_03310 [Rubellimicrobium sp.]|nr:hypothetical protein [Rubellimicrobium sp.]